MRFITLLLAAMVAVATPAAAQRVEVPIKAVVLSDGVRRYSITVTINGQPVEAGLDTGSTGLRVLAASLPGGAGLRGETVHYGYGSGVEFAGAAVSVSLGIGTLPPRNAKVQRIDKVGCSGRNPECAAKELVGAGTYLIQGDGLSGQGFPAIIGIGLHADTVANPLIQLGAKRWIVELPLSPAASGRLVLNPDDAEVARYTQVDFIGDTNQVAGCIVAADASKKLCAPAMVDTGAIGLRVQGGSEQQILPNGTPALLVIGDGDHTASMPVVIGRRDQASAMRLYPARQPGKLSLSLGIAPYLHWSVLYDADHRRIGVAER